MKINMAAILKRGKYFQINELIGSKVAEEKGIFNLPLDEKVIENLNYSVSRMDEIREGYGKPININSWYRCKDLNEAVGGAKNSYHMSGLAVDLRWDSDLLYHIIEKHNFHKLIREESGNSKWIHIQFLKDRSKEENKVISIQK